MATTQYMPMTRFEKAAWALSDGTVIEEPPLEMSRSAKKARVEGDTETVFMKDLDDLLYRHAVTVATAKGAYVVARVDNDQRVLNNALITQARASGESVTALSKAATLNLDRFVDVDRRGAVSTQIWWKFKHPTLPVYAAVAVTLTSSHSSWFGVDVRAQVPMLGDRLTEPVYQMSARHAAAMLNVHDLMDEEHTDPTVHNHNSRANNLKEAVTALHGVVTAVDDLSTISVPLKDPDGNASWVDFEFDSTNCNGAFLEDLTEASRGEGW